jgi:hypothetical protein
LDSLTPAVVNEVSIDPRFRGPPDSANGGYTCGLLAASIEGPAEVTLKAPPPLSRTLQIQRQDLNVVLTNGDAVIAEARSSTVECEVPDAVGLEEARAAGARYPWREKHPYPTCFVCGPERQAGDGLGIFPGPVEDRQIYAAPWTPERSLAHADGSVRDEFVWAALDCPSGIVTDLFGEVGLVLLGRLTADIRKPLTPGLPYVIQAWTESRDGRKLNTASAIFSADGEFTAVARAVWIELRPSGPT